MEIDYTNCNKTISSINIHDFEFIGVKYNYIQKAVTIMFQNSFSIIASDVVFYEASSLQPWFCGVNVYDFDTMPEETVYSYINRISKDLTEEVKLKECFGVELLINSGDFLRIICKRLCFSSEDYCVEQNDISKQVR